MQGTAPFLSEVAFVEEPGGDIGWQGGAILLLDHREVEV